MEVQNFIIYLNSYREKSIHRIWTLGHIIVYRHWYAKNVNTVHIELIKIMNILALIRFCNIYDIPTHVYGDNARFITDYDIIGEVFNSNKFSDHFSSI